MKLATNDNTNISIINLTNANEGGTSGSTYNISNNHTYIIYYPDNGYTITLRNSENQKFYQFSSTPAFVIIHNRKCRIYDSYMNIINEAQTTAQDVYKVICNGSGYVIKD